jgi:formate/nitrite transporter
MLVMVTGTQLFTGNTMLVLPAAQDRVSVGETLRDWSVVWIANLVGSLAIAALFVASGATDALDGAVGRAALDTAATKLGKSWPELFASGVLANMLVCLAVWMAIGAKSVGGKIAAVIGPVALFVAAGFEHSIANMALLPIAWGIDPAAVPIAGLVGNLLLVTAGNIVGGSLVAIVLAAGHRVLHL